MWWLWGGVAVFAGEILQVDVRLAVACGGCGDAGGNPHVSTIVIAKLVVPGKEH